MISFPRTAWFGLLLATVPLASVGAAELSPNAAEPWTDSTPIASTPVNDQSAPHTTPLSDDVAHSEPVPSTPAIVSNEPVPSTPPVVSGEPVPSTPASGGSDSPPTTVDLASDVANPSPLVQMDGKGLRVTSSNGRFFLQLRGYGQFVGEHVVDIFEEENQYVYDTYSDVYQSGFRVRRLRPNLTIGLGEAARLHIEFNLNEKGAQLFNAFAELKAHDRLRFKIGQQQSLLNAEQSQSSRNMLFIERSYASSLTPQRDTGVVLDLRPVSGIQLEAAVFNGADDNKVGGKIDDPFPEFQGRLQISPFRFNPRANSPVNLVLGAAFSHGKVRDDEYDRDKGEFARSGGPHTLGGADFQLLRREYGMHGMRTRGTGFLHGSVGGLFLLAEYVYSHTEYREEYSSVYAQAWNISAAYTFGGSAGWEGVTPKRNAGDGGLGALQVKARFHQLRYYQREDNGGTRIVEYDSFEKHTEAIMRGVSSGLAWWANPHVRVQADYHYTAFPDLQSWDTIPKREHFLQLSTTIGF